MISIRCPHKSIKSRVPTTKHPQRDNEEPRIREGAPCSLPLQVAFLGAYYDTQAWCRLACGQMIGRIHRAILLQAPVIFTDWLQVVPILGTCQTVFTFFFGQAIGIICRPSHIDLADSGFGRSSRDAWGIRHVEIFHSLHKFLGGYGGRLSALRLGEQSSQSRWLTK